uniref:Mid2 domain-containing protein n=1 Tax=Panagrellus redivivus TaxID=6233 RepID=A0A7E4ZUB2_PANRE
MHRVCALLILAVAVCNGSKPIELVEDAEKTVTFTDDALQIRIDSSGDTDRHLFICFQSTSMVAQAGCPVGFGLYIFLVTAGRSSTTFALKRDGTVSDTDEKIKGIRFGKDGSIKVLMPEIPDGFTVYLDNVEKVIDGSNKSDGHNKVVIGAVFGVIAIIIVAIVGGLLVWFCFLRKKLTQHPVQLANREDEVPLTIDDGEQRPLLTSNVAPPTPALPPSAVETKPSTTTPTKPSPAPKRSQSAPPTPAPSASKPQPTPAIEAIVTPTTPATPKPIPAKKVTAPKHRSKSVPPSKTPTIVEKPKSSPIKTDSTQSPTNQTEPTPDFTHTGTGNVLAKDSACKALNYLSRGEAPKPGQPRRRSVPVVDEVEFYKRSTAGVHIRLGNAGVAWARVFYLPARCPFFAFSARSFFSCERSVEKITFVRARREHGHAGECAPLLDGDLPLLLSEERDTQGPQAH